MQQLSGLDAMFLSVDTSTTTGVMGGLLIYERSDDEEAGRAPAMRGRIAERMDQIPPLRWRLTKVPLNLANAYWAQDDRIDLDEHVHTLTLPQPGDDHVLAAEVARIMSLPLRMDRPMWDFYVIEGLEGGRIAHLIRVHHGMVDGGMVPTLLDLLSDDPVTPPEVVDSLKAPPRRPEPVGGSAEMLLRGVGKTVTRPVRFAAFEIGTARWMVGQIREDGVLAAPAFVARLIPGELGAPLRKLLNRRQKAKGAPEVLSLVPTLRKPATPFNGTLSPRRSYAFSDLPFADFKRVGKAFGGTLNDAVLAVCAGALRRYLQDRGGVPERPLVVCIPASLRTDETKYAWENHVSMFFAELPTHLDDPLERFRAVSAGTKAAKANFEALPLHQIKPLIGFIPAAAVSGAERLLAKAPNWLPAAAWNVVVSNVRGPAKPVTTTGLRMLGYWPAAFLTPSVGLNITLQSYVDRLDFGFMGCTDLVGDLWTLTGYMGEELEVLLDAAEKVSPSAGSAERARTPSDGRGRGRLRAADDQQTKVPG